MEEEYPDVAAYLASLASSPPSFQTTTAEASPPRGSEYHAAREAEGLTSSLLASVREIMVRAEAEGTDPDDDELHALVERTVVQGMVIGNGWADQQRQSVIEESAAGADGVANNNKRRRIDEGGPNGAA